MPLAVKEEMLSPSSDPCVFFPLAADPAELETRFGETSQLSKNSRPGFARKNLALHQGSAWTNLGTALGLEPLLRREGLRSRCTGKERDAESGLDHFDFRKYSSSLGRFMTPDPAGIFVADTSFPQSWNLYSYVRNNPLNFIDPRGLDCAYLNDAGTGAESIDHNSNIGECEQNGGYWANGTINQLSWVQPNVNNDTAVIYSQFSNGGIGVSLASQTWTQGAFGLSDEASSSLYSFQQWTPLNWNERAIREIEKALPTVCGGGAFFYAGVQGKKKGVGGFVGYLGEWDSNSGYSHNGLGELGGEHGAGGVAVSTNGRVDGLAFVPAGPVGEFGGGVTDGTAFGFYAGTPEKFPVGIGGGAYLNLTSNAGCRAVQGQHP